MIDLDSFLYVFEFEISGINSREDLLKNSSKFDKRGEGYEFRV